MEIKRFGNGKLHGKKKITSMEQQLRYLLQINLKLIIFLFWFLKCKDTAVIILVTKPSRLNALESIFIKDT